MKFIAILVIFSFVCANASTLRMRAPYNYERRNAGSREMNPCRMPMDPGMGYAHIPSYFFDYQQGMCVPFIYGGMMGNANRFSTLGECEISCLMH